MYHERPIPEINKAATIIKQDIMKLSKLLVTIVIGKISLGKYIFFKIPAFAITQPAHWVIDKLKKFQGIKAITKKDVKWGISAFVMKENTNE